MMSSEEQRFRELGIKCPNLNFMQKDLSAQERWGLESKYNTRTLEGNWYEDRRGYKQICPRCTGHSITRTDYLANCKEAYSKNDTFPPSIYAHRLKQEGEGVNFLRNTEDYCEYLENYTTTYDLMHNWEVRRAGCEPKPWRRWKLVKDNSWFPERDNALAYGNLTQIGYRKAPQLPLLPNDWDVYANVSTTYNFDYAPLKYPDDFVHCRAGARATKCKLPVPE